MVQQPPEVLRRLFQLKYVGGIFDGQMLAEKLGVKRETLHLLEALLDEILREKINVITPERLEMVCPECLNARVYTDPETGERVCGACGYVFPESQGYDESLPFDTTYALASDLAFGKSLGGTLTGKALMRVLAKSGNGASDLGIRATQIRVVAETCDVPPLKSVLAHAKKLAERYSLDELFQQDLGRNIRRAFWLCWMLDVKISNKVIAETVFWFTLCMHRREAIVEKSALKVEPALLKVLLQLDEVLDRWRSTLKPNLEAYRTVIYALTS
ncbi:MAG: TFIIB-type zinc ribbon-containing protein [Candidatus Norongarragalinales archaeon]